MLSSEAAAAVDVVQEDGVPAMFEPSKRQEPAGQVDVLAVHEQAGIEPFDPLECRPADNQTTTSEPIEASRSKRPIVRNPGIWSLGRFGGYHVGVDEDRFEAVEAAGLGVTVGVHEGDERLCALGGKLVGPSREPDVVPCVVADP